MKRIKKGREKELKPKLISKSILRATMLQQLKIKKVLKCR